LPLEKANMIEGLAGEGREAEKAERPKQVYRIVIGAYPAPDLARSATQDLRLGGLGEAQLCVISKGEPDSAGDVPRRRIADEVVEVSEPRLFDKIWAGSASGQPFAPWMTRSQAKAILESLKGGALVLMVSAASAKEQVKASQIQLNHHPTMVQAYSFTA
jgi:hypothetical protein